MRLDYLFFDIIKILVCKGDYEKAIFDFIGGN
ncbi:hypothetical protein cco77_00235 [Campylobacter coli LMG 23341]|nr:hypothetical protein cco77_00235 [Campylobacter coli LMG 23341]